MILACAVGPTAVVEWVCRWRKLRASILRPKYTERALLYSQIAPDCISAQIRLCICGNGRMGEEESEIYNYKLFTFCRRRGVGYLLGLDPDVLVTCCLLLMQIASVYYGVFQSYFFASVHEF